MQIYSILPTTRQKIILDGRTWNRAYLIYLEVIEALYHSKKYFTTFQNKTSRSVLKNRVIDIASKTDSRKLHAFIQVFHHISKQNYATDLYNIYV